MPAERLIITAASEAFGPSLLAMLGSLTLNWPDHPPVLVYDLGLSAPFLTRLARNNISVRKVPEFCPHWRKYYTWKTWCWNDAPAAQIFWLDSGVAVLQPAPEIFTSIERLGYFAVYSCQSLAREASPYACQSTGVSAEAAAHLPTIAGGIIGFDKAGRAGGVVKEAFRLAQDENNVRPFAPEHRHEQALVSLLMHRDLGPLVISDYQMYCYGEKPPGAVPGQKLWVFRRWMHPGDAAYLAEHISTPGAPFIPRAVPPPERKWYHLPGRIARRGLRVLGVRPRPQPPTPHDGVRDGSTH